MLSGTQMGDDHRRMRANRKVVEATCLTCRGAFAFGEEVCACAVCGAYHHAKCWDGSPGCRHNSAASTTAVEAAPVAALGTVVSIPAPRNAEPEKGATLENQTADSHPGVLIKGRPLFCVECGTSVEQDWKLCPRCGKQVEAIPRIVSTGDVVCRRCDTRMLPGQGYAVYPEAAQGDTADHRVFLATVVPGSFEPGDIEIRKLDIGLYCDACAGVVFSKKVWDEARALRIEMDLQDTHTFDGKRAQSEVLDFAIALPAKRRGVTPEQARSEARELGQLWWTDQNAARQRLTGTNAVSAPMPQEVGKPKDCPHCRLVNPGSAGRCDCGYDFTLGKMGPPLASAPVPVPSLGASHQSGARRPLAEDEQYCSQCREIIKLNALKCRYCGYVLNAQLNSQEIPGYIATEVEKQANKALWCGIIGLFICAPILGTMAITNGNGAIEILDRYPLFPGPRGRANTGRVLGWIAWVLFVIVIIGKVSSTGNAPR